VGAAARHVASFVAGPDILPVPVNDAKSAAGFGTSGAQPRRIGAKLPILCGIIHSFDASTSSDSHLEI
jgi:hypothetical protein